MAPRIPQQLAHNAHIAIVRPTVQQASLDRPLRPHNRAPRIADTTILQRRIHIRVGDRPPQPLELVQRNEGVRAPRVRVSCGPKVLEGSAQLQDVGDTLVGRRRLRRCRAARAASARETPRLVQRRLPRRPQSHPVDVRDRQLFARRDGAQRVYGVGQRARGEGVVGVGAAGVVEALGAGRQ